ncbi:e9imm peptide [Actinoplanes missouriensis]|uniref:e9imm peptide n=1 Tax=Actinoplanes missouriensis TaxID=1866 RepID=UPI0034030125
MTDPRRTLDESVREQAIGMIHRLRDPRIPDEAAGALISELERLLAYPRVSDLLFWRTPELTDEEVVEEALRYRPLVG